MMESSMTLEKIVKERHSTLIREAEEKRMLNLVTPARTDVSSGLLIRVFQRLMQQVWMLI